MEKQEKWSKLIGLNNHNTTVAESIYIWALFENRLNLTTGRKVRFRATLHNRVSQIIVLTSKTDKYS